MTGPILVIKHGALGDIIQVFPHFAAIRRHHQGAHIAALTGPAFAHLLKDSPYFDEVRVDARRSPWNIGANSSLILSLRLARFARVYDLQNSERTQVYRRLMGVRDWSGSERGGEPQHHVDRLFAQIERSGVVADRSVRPDWLTGDVGRLGLPARFVLFIPGSSPHLPWKRWPHYPDLAQMLLAEGLTPVLIGTDADAGAIGPIVRQAPGCIDLSGRMSLGQVAELGRRALAAVANDTGPTFLVAAVGCPITWTLSSHTDVALSLPRGAEIAAIQADDISKISAAIVREKMLFRS